MGEKGRIIGATGVAFGIIALLCTALWFHNIRPAEPSTNALNAIAIIDVLPQNHRFVGEARLQGKLSPLVAQDNQLMGEGVPQSVALRFIDNNARYYDISIGPSVVITGLLPRTPISVTSGDTVIYRQVPSDWNGRIMFATPAAPLALSFSQNSHEYRIHIPHMIGGAT